MELCEHAYRGDQALMGGMQEIGTQLNALLALLIHKGVITGEELADSRRQIEVAYALEELANPDLAAMRDKLSRISEAIEMHLREGETP
jgi:hypothetical protein